VSSGVRKTIRITALLLKGFIRRPVWLILQLAAIAAMVVFYQRIYRSEPALAIHMTAYARDEG